jgi:flagellar biosynthesis chaperone FliJ
LGHFIREKGVNHVREAREEDVLQALDKLIQKSEDVLESTEEELQQARATLLTLTVKEHVIGTESLSEEEEKRKEGALSHFRDLRNTINSEKERLKRLRAAREEWETGLPNSLRKKFEDLLSTG